jgi:Predicted membrane protein (DUF2232)
MFRRLSAIEIAEGALLADIAVILQLLTLYLPIGGEAFRFLIFVVFTILVLRRGLYAGIMGMCTALFLVGVISGINFLPIMLLEGMGGLFLGVTMKHFWHHIPLLFVGITCGAAALFILVLGTDFLLRIPIAEIVLSLHRIFTRGIALMSQLTASFGLGGFWQQNLLPIVEAIGNLAFTYWLAAFYVLFWIGLCPVVISIYYVTSLLVRMLGYEVRPFPGGRLRKLLHWLARKLVWLVGKSPLGKYQVTRNILTQIRVYIGRI